MSLFVQGLINLRPEEQVLVNVPRSFTPTARRLLSRIFTSLINLIEPRRAP